MNTKKLSLNNSLRRPSNSAKPNLHIHPACCTLRTRPHLPNMGNPNRNRIPNNQPAAGLGVSLLNTAVLFAIFPGALPTGPVYNLAATLSMQVGIFAAVAIGKRFFCSKNPDTNILSKAKWAAAATTLGILTRVAFMSVVLLLCTSTAIANRLFIPLGMQQSGTCRLPHSSMQHWRYTQFRLAGLLRKGFKKSCT